MSSTELDGLLNDLELACQDTSGVPSHTAGAAAAGAHSLLLNSSDSHLEGRSGTSDLFLSSNGPKSQHCHPEAGDQAPPPVPQRGLESVIATTSMGSNRVASNLNELDVLLQDLSSAR